MYTPEQIQEANKFLETLYSLDNKDITIINDGKKCTDKNRNETIIGLLIEDYGDNIFKHVRIKWDN